jgi:hypothetical protein
MSAGAVKFQPAPSTTKYGTDLHWAVNCTFRAEVESFPDQIARHRRTPNDNILIANALREAFVCSSVLR